MKRVRGKALCLTLGIIFFFGGTPKGTAQEAGYFQQWGKTFNRGLKNIVSAPLEIPYTVGKYDRESGNPRVLRDTAGFFDGLFRTVTRLGCGVWDVVFASVPGAQEGLPLKPESFF